MILLVLAGCATSMDLGRATTLDPGEARWSGGLAYSTISPRLSSETDYTTPWIQLEAGYHRGLGDRWEAGGRAWGMGWPTLFTTVGLAIDGKYQVHRGAVDLALAASAIYYRPALGGAPWHVGGVQLPLLVGFDMGPHQLVLSPRVGAWAWGAYGQTAQSTWSAGLGVAMAFDLGAVELTPEYAWSWSPVSFNGEVIDAGKLGVSGSEIAVAISWGGAGMGVR